jgi:hypothetical protein
MRCYARRVETQDDQKREDQKRNEETRERARAGLCADCLHARRIESDRAAKFYLCDLAAVDPAYRKYPVLPVIRCAGFQPKG